MEYGRDRAPWRQTASVEEINSPEVQFRPLLPQGKVRERKERSGKEEGRELEAKEREKVGKGRKSKVRSP